MSTDIYMPPFGTDIDLVSGVMADPDEHLVQKASALRGYYADAAALERLIEEEGDPVHYEVFEKTIPEECGNLKLGISRLRPGLVGDECFMTKGHFHEIRGTAEIYLCNRGKGYMLMKTPDNEQCVAEPMVPNRMVYVPPHWAHRSINAGDEPLISFFAYPADAGHNYGDIADEGFPKRVFIRNGKVAIEPSSP